MPLTHENNFQTQPHEITDMNADLQLMCLMCSRFCHDLAAPLGAIAIGLDMLETSDDPGNPQSILKHSVQSAMHKLELMRCLSGYATAPNHPTLGEAREIIEKSIDPEKYNISWHPVPDEDIYDRIFGNGVRLYVALFMISLDAMPRGGDISLNRDFSLTLTGPLIRFNEQILKALNGDFTLNDIDSRVIVGHFAHMLAERLNTKIHVNFEKPNLVRIYFE